MGRKLRRGIRAAIKAAQLSEFYAHRVGAVIFKGSVPVAIGYNRHKSHPDNVCFTQHAEFNAILRCKDRYDPKTLTMFVARLTRTDYLSYCKPCDDCQGLITETGLKRVYFSNYQGKAELLTSELVSL